MQQNFAQRDNQPLVEIRLTVYQAAGRQKGGLKVHVLLGRSRSGRQAKNKRSRKQKARLHRLKVSRQHRIDWDEVSRLLEKSEEQTPEYVKRAREAEALEEAKRFSSPEATPGVEELRRLYLRRPIE